jgi:hypothetical protein
MNESKQYYGQAVQDSKGELEISLVPEIGGNKRVQLGQLAVSRSGIRDDTADRPKEDELLS